MILRKDTVIIIVQDVHLEIKKKIAQLIANSNVKNALNVGAMTLIFHSVKWKLS